MRSSRQPNAPKLAPVFAPKSDPSFHAPNKLVIAGVMVAVVALVIGLIVHFLIATNTAHVTTGGVGSTAPNFTITLWDGPNAKEGAKPQTLSLSSLRGHPVVVFFWSQANLQSEGVAPTIENMSKQYALLGVDFVGVGIATNNAGGQAFIKQAGLTFPNGPDTTGSIAKAYGLAGTPSTVYIDQTGKIVDKLEGETDAGMLDYALRMYLLDGIPPLGTPGS